MGESERTDSSGNGEADDGDGSLFDEAEVLSAKTTSVREWLLLDGNRLAVAGIVLAVVLAVLVVYEQLGWVPMERDQPTFYVFSSLISGNLTLITVVVSINQLLLGRELKTPGTLENQIQNVIEYREEVEEHAGQIAPVKPLGFLEVLFENTRRDAQRIGGMTFGAVGSETRSQVDDTVEALTDHMDRVLDVLENSDTDTFDVLSVTLTTNYAQQINQIRRIRANHGDDLPESVMDALDNLIEHLQKVDVARQYFKSLYLQEELSELSRVLLYAGVPAELISVLVLLGLTGNEGTLVIEYTHIILPLAVTIAFVPVALLLSYIMRTATVTERTAATIPFTTSRQEK